MCDSVTYVFQINVIYMDVYFFLSGWWRYQQTNEHWEQVSNSTRFTTLDRCFNISEIVRTPQQQG